MWLQTRWSPLSLSWFTTGNKKYPQCWLPDRFSKTHRWAEILSIKIEINLHSVGSVLAWCEVVKLSWAESRQSSYLMFVLLHLSAQSVIISDKSGSTCVMFHFRKRPVDSEYKENLFLSSEGNPLKIRKKSLRTHLSETYWPGRGILVRLVSATKTWTGKLTVLLGCSILTTTTSKVSPHGKFHLEAKQICAIWLSSSQMHWLCPLPNQTLSMISLASPHPVIIWAAEEDKM